MTDEERRAYEEYVFSEDYFDEFRKLREVSDIMSPKEFKRAQQLISTGLADKYEYRSKISAKYNKKTPWWRKLLEKREQKKSLNEPLKQSSNQDEAEIKARPEPVEKVVNNKLLSQSSSVTTEELLGTTDRVVLLGNSKTSKSAKESEALAD